LNANRAREDPADQDDDTAGGVIPDVRRRVGGRGGIIEHRHAKQLGRCDESGKGRQPEIEPQRRENDEDEIGKGHHESQRLNQPHIFDVHRQCYGRQRGFDQRPEVAPDYRHIAIKP
jgi:hypothetical protein